MTQDCTCQRLQTKVKWKIRAYLPYPVLDFHTTGVQLNQSMCCEYAGLFSAILRKGPLPKFEKNDRLHIKIGRN